MTKKKIATEQKTSKSADGKTWVMPEAKPKAAKKGSGKKAQRPPRRRRWRRRPASAPPRWPPSR